MPVRLECSLGLEKPQGCTLPPPRTLCLGLFLAPQNLLPWTSHSLCGPASPLQSLLALFPAPPPPANLLRLGSWCGSQLLQMIAQVGLSYFKSHDCRLGPVNIGMYPQRINAKKTYFWCKLKEQHQKERNGCGMKGETKLEMCRKQGRAQNDKK